MATPRSSGAPTRVAAALAILLTVAGCAAPAQRGGAGRGHGRRGGRPVPAAPVAIAPAQAGSVQPTLVLAGIVAPWQNVAITTQLNEPVASVAVLQGARVRAGETLAVLDVADLRAQLLAARGTLENARAAAASAQARVAQARYNGQVSVAGGVGGVDTAGAALAQAKATLRNDLENLRRDETLAAQGYIPQQTLQQARTLALTDQSAVNAAQANARTAATGGAVNGSLAAGLPAATIAAAQADARAAQGAILTAEGQARNLEASIARATIVSPVDGSVVNRNVNPGEYPGGRTLFTVQELRRVYVNLNASSADVFAVRAGTPVDFTVGGTARRFRGAVSAVLGQVAPGSTNFTVQAIVANTDGALQAGMAATGTLRLPAVAGVAIPTTAFLDDTHQAVLRAQTSAGRRVARRVAVVERAEADGRSIVTGLPAGASVVVNGQLGVGDGQDITPPTPAPRGTGAPGGRRRRRDADDAE